MPLTTAQPITEATLLAAAHALREARVSGRAIPPISQTYGLQGLDDAYAVAAINNRARIDQGARVVGHKIGLTSVAVQAQLGVDRPDFGLLFDDMEILDDGDVPMARLMQPKAEAEVAFVLERDLGDAVPSWAEFLRCVGYALPAIEIVDSAIAGWKIALADTVADNASSALYVLGNQPVSVGALALDKLPMRMTRDGAAVSTGGGAACLGHPLRAAYWLARTMAALGQPLRAGEVILSGALGPMVPIAAGEAIVAEFGPLGAVSCRIV